jgi:hypothetical protein
MGGACRTQGDTRNGCTILVGKRNWKIQLEILRRRWKDNIKMDHKEIGKV